MKAKDIDIEINERQLNQLKLIVNAIHGSKHKPSFDGYAAKETGEIFLAIEFEAGDENVAVMLGTEEVIVAIDSDDEHRRGRFTLSEDYEHQFIGGLISSIWKNEYESLVSEFFESDPSRN